MKKWIIVAIVLFALDQVSKWIVVSQFATEGDSITIIKNVLDFTYVRNGGLVWGLEQGATAQYVIPLALLAAAAMGVFIYLFSQIDFSDKRTKWYALALSLLMAGTLGNGIDRLFQSDHKVIDFIDVELFGGFMDRLLAVFNLADTYLNVGLVLLFIDIFFLEKKRVKAHE
jgi:signal peptidase II